MAQSANPDKQSDLILPSSGRTVDRRGRLFLAGAVVVMGSLALAGCAPNAGATPNEPEPNNTSGSSSTPTPGGETSTPNPEAPTSGLKVNFERFNGWESKSEAERLAACEEFLDANAVENKAASIELSPNMDGGTASSWFQGRADLIYELFANGSAQEQQIAKYMIDCITVKHEPTDSAHTYLDQQFTVIANYGNGNELNDIVARLTKINKHSNGTFLSTDPQGTQYSTFAVEGISNDFSKSAMYYAFEFTGTNPADYNLRATVIQSASLNDTSDNFGDKDPIIVP